MRSRSPAPSRAALPASDPVVPGRRPDVQGLRALAVVLVLGFHAHVPFLPGGYVGVDVFFVVSGFVITRMLLVEHHATGRIDLRRFVRRRIERLVPLTIVVVAVTVLVARSRLPPLASGRFVGDGVAALAGVENVVLAARGSDYLAGTSPGLFQQFWSLGVEWQFYAVAGPLLALALRGVDGRARVAALVGFLSGLSFLSIPVVATLGGAWAFHSAPTRAWEFGVGALVALACVGRRSLPAVAAVPVRLAGVAAIATAALCLGDSTPFPGVATLLPVLGAAAIVVPAARARADLVTRVLSSGPAVRLGAVSFSVYLWHWPVLVLPAIAWGTPLPPVQRAVAVAVVVAASFPSERFLERAPRRWAERIGGVRAVSALAAVSVCVAVAGVATVPQRVASSRTASAPTVAEVLDGPAATRFVPANARPSLTGAAEDLPAVYRDGCIATLSADARHACGTERDTGAGTIVLFGDSQAAQWASPLRTIAAGAGMRLVVVARAACPAADIAVRNPQLRERYTACERWRADALTRIAALRPTVVVVAEATSIYEGHQLGPRPFASQWRRGMDRSVRRLGAGRVVLLRETPRWDADPNACLSAHVDAARECERPVTDPHTADVRRMVDDFAASATVARVVDPTPWLCSDRCPAVLWDVVVYRDEHHLTDVAARTMTPRLRTALHLQRKM
ncbi:acyltransferase family protein [Curtobacterium sp. RRHDQ10]|uniref:acyltransferase family protein n=1 Tax=Curtobacterium phyllosphaerae TaxID=3413379 RepID=UPI003BF39370